MRDRRQRLGAACTPPCTSRPDRRGRPRSWERRCAGASTSTPRNEGARLHREPRLERQKSSTCGPLVGGRTRFCHEFGRGRVRVHSPQQLLQTSDCGGSVTPGDRSAQPLVVVAQGVLVAEGEMVKLDTAQRPPGRFIGRVNDRKNFIDLQSRRDVTGELYGLATKTLATKILADEIAQMGRCPMHVEDTHSDHTFLSVNESRVADVRKEKLSSYPQLCFAHVFPGGDAGQ